MIRWACIGAMILTLSGQALMAEKLTGREAGVFVGVDYEEDFDFPAGETLTINSAATLTGSIVVTAGAERPRIVYRKALKTGSKTEAEEFAEAIKVEIGRDTEGPLISLRAPSNAPWSGTNKSGRLELEVFLPDDCSLIFNTSYFDIDAVGPFSELTVTESLSRIQVDNVRQATSIKVSNRPLEAVNLSGKLAISNKYGRIKLEKINTGGETGTVRNEHGEIIIDSYQGSLDVRTSYDRLSARNLYLIGSKNRIKNVSAPILLEFDSLNTGIFRINNQYEQITLDIAGEVAARFICKNGEAGRVVVENMTIEPTLVYDNRLEFTAGSDIGDNAAEVRVSAKEAGDIIISGPE
ncbi:MAG: hypothetical protein GY841_08405 [FCB group bacterium]|nr:hypothetical protein [FCB group bacterium]